MQCLLCPTFVACLPACLLACFAQIPHPRSLMACRLGSSVHWLAVLHESVSVSICECALNFFTSYAEPLPPNGALNPASNRGSPVFLPPRTATPENHGHRRTPSYHNSPHISRGTSHPARTITVIIIAAIVSVLFIVPPPYAPSSLPHSFYRATSQALPALLRVCA